METPTTTRKGLQKSVLLPREMWDKLQGIADADYCSVSQVIRNILRNELD